MAVRGAKKFSEKEYQIKRAFRRHASEINEEEVLSVLNDLYKCHSRPITQIEIFKEFINRKKKEFQEKTGIEREVDLFESDVTSVREKFMKRLRSLVEYGRIINVPLDELDPEIAEKVEEIAKTHGYQITQVRTYLPKD